MLGGTIDGQALQFLVKHILEGLDELLPYRLRGLMRQWRRVAPVTAVWLPVDGVLTHVGLQLFQRFVQQGRNRFPCLARKRIRARLFVQVSAQRVLLPYEEDPTKKTEGL